MKIGVPVQEVIHYHEIKRHGLDIITELTLFHCAYCPCDSKYCSTIYIRNVKDGCLSASGLTGEIDCTAQLNGMVGSS